MVPFDPKTLKQNFPKRQRSGSLSQCNMPNGDRIPNKKSQDKVSKFLPHVKSKTLPLTSFLFWLPNQSQKLRKLLILANQNRSNRKPKICLFAYIFHKHLSKNPTWGRKFYRTLVTKKPVFTCSKLTIKISRQQVKYVQS